MRITYVGHATVLLEVDGTVLLTDPVLRPRVAHLHRYAPAPEPTALPRPDAVLVSHAHHDHLDLPTLRALPAPPSVVGPVGVAALVGRLARAVVELEPGERTRIGAVAVRATPAMHDGRRLPWLRAIRSLGFVVEGDVRAYFAGDTGLFADMADVDPALDVALLPIAGWGARLGPGHLDPEGAARALTLLRPRVAIPIHWGTYASPRARPADPWAPARAFATCAARLAPEVEVRLLAPGCSATIAPARLRPGAAAAGARRGSGAGADRRDG